jgi:hypothetical protein
LLRQIKLARTLGTNRSLYGGEDPRNAALGALVPPEIRRGERQDGNRILPVAQ